LEGRKLNSKGRVDTKFISFRRDELLLHIGMEDNRFYILNNWISPKLPMKEHYDDEENKNEQTVLFH
jgi:hypothetical protein